MNEQLDERLRTAARTYHRLGNQSAESMFLEAADTICKIQAENTKLRDDVERMFNVNVEKNGEIVRLLDENAKLRELARGLGQCAQGVGCEDCLLYDLSEPDHCREERLSRELGIEVDG